MSLLRSTANINRVNKAIEAKYPGVRIMKDKWDGGANYFYVYSDNEAMSIKLAGLYSKSILVDKITQMTVEEWVEAVEYVLLDTERPNALERTPAITI